MEKFKEVFNIDKRFKYSKKIIVMFGVVLFSILCIEVKSYALIPEVKTTDEQHENVQDQRDEKLTKMETLDESQEEMLDQDDDKKLPDVKNLGGSYAEVYDQTYDHKKFHAHHLISKQAWYRLGKKIAASNGRTSCNKPIRVYRQCWAPAILMNKEDHEQTRSFCNKHSSDEVKAKAKTHIAYETEQLCTQGAVMQLLNEECDDIRKKFPGKYDEAVLQMFGAIRGQFQHTYKSKVLRIALDPNKFVYYKFKKCHRYVRKGA